MKKVLKNHLRGHIDQIFRGRKVTFRSKSSKIFDMEDEEEKAEFFFWKDMYGFLEDITDKTDINKGGEANDKS
jgi:hypothetical protein